MPFSRTRPTVFARISAEPPAQGAHTAGSARLSAGLQLLIHVSLPFRRPAAENTLSGWEHIPARTARLPQLTSRRSFLCERAGCQVSEASFSSPEPLNSWASTQAATRDLLYRTTIMGTVPYFSNLWRWIGPTLASPQPLPVSSASGRTCGTTPESAVGGAWICKVCVRRRRVSRS